MITVEEAREILGRQIKDFGVEQVALGHASGRVLREPMLADRDFPPYDRVTMDGIAIRFEDYEDGHRTFEVAGIAAAGAPRQRISVSGQCLEVMTGAILPDGLDTVIPYEQIELEEGQATLRTEELAQGKNIHRKGTDRSTGSAIVREGKVISAAEIGIAATVGLSSIAVSRLPKTLIVSSGDELVEVHELPKEHQIRQSNIHQIQATLASCGITADRAHLLDDYESIVEKMRRYVEAYDLIVLSGGVSKGKFDWIPKALEAVGAEKLFHRVKQRPGKPFWLGAAPSGTSVFAFPGNPISSFMCLHEYLLPWLQACLQMGQPPKIWASLAEEVHFKPDLTYFPQVRIVSHENGRLSAIPVRGNGSGDLASLVDGDAFMELPQGSDTFKVGESYEIRYYR